MMTMEFQKALIGVGTSVFALYLLNTVYGTLWKSRHIPVILHTLFYLVFICVWFTADLIPNYSLNFFWGWGLYFLASLYYQAIIREQILLSCLCMLIALSIEYTIGFLLSFLFRNDFNQLLENNIIFYLCGAFISKLILFIIAKGFQFFHQERLEELSLKGILPILTFPITSIITGLTIMKISPAISEERMEMPVAVIFLLLTCSSLYFIHVIEKQAKQDKDRQKLQHLEERYRSQLISYQKLYDRQEKILKYKHNMKNKLLAISGMINAGDIQKAAEHIMAECGEVDAASDFAPTGTPSLDAVLFEKLLQASKSDIKFSYQISIPELQINEIDFCILIANALDNALEACSRIERTIQAYIKMDIHTNGNYILIDIVNPALKPTKCCTWKADKENHGLGFKSMQKTAEKYGGNISYKYNSGVFYLNAMLKNG